MADRELISIIMPAYNAEKTVARAIESVLQQTYPHWELIVVDDCSRDGTPAMLRQLARQDERIRVLVNEENLGASHTRHRAVEAACGQWLAFLDSDDAWVSSKLEKQILLQRQTQAKLVFTGSAFMDADGEPIDWYLHVPGEIEYRKLLKQNLISNSSVLVHKQTYLQHEVIGNNMHEDFACWLRFLRAGETACGIDEPLLIYRLSAASKSGNKRKAAKMNWNAYRAAGVNIFVASYSMCWYAVNGLMKYRQLRKEARR